MLKISERLIEVASLVPKGCRLADVGTDHGYVPIWLLQNQYITSAIAMDVNRGPLKRAEEWDIYNSTGRPATWKFMKGLFMERFDEHFHIDLFVQADTAYLHEQRTWELRGRVVIRNMKNEVFHTEELYWDMTTHEMWSHMHMRITTPERELEGTEFRSNEQMTRYSVSNSQGAFPVEDTQSTPAADSLTTAPDSTQTQPKEAPKKPTLQEHNRDRKGTEGMRFPPAPGKR